MNPFRKRVVVLVVLVQPNPVIRIRVDSHIRGLFLNNLGRRFYVRVLRRRFNVWQDT